MNNVIRMLDAQSKELTPSMTEFHNSEHVIRIVADGYGSMTCTIRSRTRIAPGVDYTITFKKKPKLGVLYTFMTGDRLSYIAFDLSHPGIDR